MGRRRIDAHGLHLRPSRIWWTRARIGGPTGEKLEQCGKPLRCARIAVWSDPPIPRWSGEFPARV
jgi:hypothetical protein